MPSARWGKYLTILTWTMSPPSLGIDAGDSCHHITFYLEHTKRYCKKGSNKFDCP